MSFFAAPGTPKPPRIEISRRNTISTQDSPFHANRRRLFLHSTPMVETSSSEKKESFPDVDISGIMPNDSLLTKNGSQPPKKSISLFRNATMVEKPLGASGPRKGPPLRSIHDFNIEPALKRRREVVDNKPQESVHDPSEGDYWITVFGFNKRTQLKDILDLFSRHGAVVKHEIPEMGNWIFLRYGSPVHAQQALSRNGQLIGGILIGVILNRCIHGGISVQNELQNFGVVDRLAAAVDSNVIPSLSTSITNEKPFVKGVRPAAVKAFDFGPAPTSGQSIMNKIMNVFK